MFWSGFASVEHDDVAKLTLKRTASRELYAHGVVGTHFEQVVARDRGKTDIGLFTIGRKSSALGTLLQGFDKKRQSNFPFIRMRKSAPAAVNSSGVELG